MNDNPSNDPGYTHARYEGGKEFTYSCEYAALPIFIKAGSILLLAKPVEYITPATVFEITCYVYGDSARQATLFEDDGVSFNYENGAFNRLTLDFRDHNGSIKRKGTFKKKRYLIKRVEG